jgi:hypothetical protein
MSHHIAKHLLPATVLALILGAAAASAAELPSYEVSSLPATPVQLSVLGASRAHVQEQSPTATLTRDDMPATPLQLSVLTPRRHRAASTDTAGVSRN